MQIHLLSFEGPDPCARAGGAGGLASRVDGLAQTLADLGFESHLWPEVVERVLLPRVELLTEALR